MPKKKYAQASGGLHVAYIHSSVRCVEDEIVLAGYRAQATIAGSD
jgi:hypothetical protein